MEYRGYSRFVNGQPFDMYRDSKVGGIPVYENGSIEFKCTKCSSKMIFLMQLSIPSTNRIIYIFYCHKHVTDDCGWYLCCKTSLKRPVKHLNVFENIGSSMDTINLFENASISDWLSNISISEPTGETLIYFERDFTEDRVYEYDEHAMTLLENYKNRNRSEIDDEDIADHDIVRNRDLEPDGSSDSFSEDEIYYINRFQSYISRKPDTVGIYISADRTQILRYNRNGRPLSLSEFDYDAKCRNCNTNLTFELQLLPRIVQHLDKECAELARMVLGSVLFYTCTLDSRNDNETGPKDCSNGSFMEHGIVLKYN